MEPKYSRCLVDAGLMLSHCTHQSIAFNEKITQVMIGLP